MKLLCRGSRCYRLRCGDGGSQPRSSILLNPPGFILFLSVAGFQRTLQSFASTMKFLRDEGNQYIFASQAAAAVATFAVCPLDTVRYRYMAQDGTKARRHNGHYYTQLARAMRVILREEGARTFLRGSHIAVFGATASWGIYMSGYKAGQRALYGALGWDLGDKNFAADTFVSTWASLLNATLTTPVWLIKTRMQIEDASGSAATERKYSTFWRGVRHVVETDGARALWRGLQMQLAMSATNAVYFPLYELMKRRVQHATGRDKLSSAEICACTALSKSIIAFVTNPLFVIRTRLQDERSRVVDKVQYVELRNTVRTIYRREALGGFFRGVVPSVVLTAPRAALHMLLMESILAEFRRRREEGH